MRGALRVVLPVLIAGLVACDEPAPEPEMIDETPELPPPADALEAEIQRRSPTEALMMIPMAPPVRGELERGASRDFTTALRAGLCYKVLGQGGPGVRDLDLVVYDANNVLMQRDATQHERPVIGVDRAICPTEPGLYRIETRMVEGAGTYAVQVWVSQ